jgi:hypothetical protein
MTDAFIAITGISRNLELISYRFGLDMINCVARPDLQNLTMLPVSKSKEILFLGS